MKITKYEVRKDGSAVMSYKLSKYDEKLIKVLAKNMGERFSKKFCNKVILNTIKFAVLEVK